LIDGVSGGHVWAERYDRYLTDIFELQDEIAEAIVSALKLQLLPDEKKSIELRGTCSLEAYDLYLRGTRPAFGPDEQRSRVTLLEEAVRLEPDYTIAWGALANARAKWRLERPYAEREEIEDQVVRESERALAMDPRNIDALAARLQLLPPFGRFLDAEALTGQMEAIARASGDARAWHACQLWRARHLVTVGRMRETIDASQRAYESDPLDPFVENLRGRNLAYGGRYAEGRRILTDLLSRWPDNHYAAMSLVSVCVQIQDWATIDTLLAPDRLAQFPLREFDGWARWYASIMRDPSPETRRGPITLARRRFEKHGLADFIQLQLAAKVGFPDEALEIALQAQFGPPGTKDDRIGFDAYKTLTLFDHAFPEFRRDPRFVELCARCGLVDYWMTTQQWPDCLDEVAPYYDFKAQCEKVAAGPPLTPANEAAARMAV
jgi:tetratricopeptide (TPR) repeat protein